MTFLELFGLLLAGHFLADYPLQGEFLSKAKNQYNPIPGVPWYQALLAHSVIHGAIVGILTNMVLPGWGIFFGLIETFAHTLIDDWKCYGLLTFNKDQFLHISLKLIYTIVLIFCLT